MTLSEYSRAVASVLLGLASLFGSLPPALPAAEPIIITPSNTDLVFAAIPPETHIQETQIASEVVAPEPDTRHIPLAMPTPNTPAFGGNKYEWMKAVGIPESGWQYVDFIITRESGWRYTAVNSSSGATGLCQALPGSKMVSAGADYLTNPVTQLRWCHSYAIQRYQGWYSSYQFWLANHWW